MRIGVPTEIKSNEFRVGLVPGSVRELTARGHEVMVQSGAGAGIFADDAAYEKAGAAHSAHGGSRVRRGGDDRQGEGAAGGRVSPAQAGPDPVHLSASRARSGAGPRPDGIRRDRDRLRDRYGCIRRSSAARADERSRRPLGHRSRGHRAASPDRRTWRAVGRRPRRSPSQSCRAWRRCRRHACRAHGSRPRCRCVDHRPFVARGCASSTSCSKAACARSPRPWRASRPKCWPPMW